MRIHIINISDPLSTHNNTKSDNEYIYYTMKHLMTNVKALHQMFLS